MALTPASRISAKFESKTIKHILRNICLTPIVEADVEMDKCVAGGTTGLKPSRTRQFIRGEESTFGVEERRVGGDIGVGHEWQARVPV